MSQAFAQVRELGGLRRALSGRNWTYLLPHIGCLRDMSDEYLAQGRAPGILALGGAAATLAAVMSCELLIMDNG